MVNAPKLTLAAIALVLVASSAHAQGVSNQILSLAQVQTPLTVAPGAVLDFGSVFPGIAKTVLATDAAAGRFDVTGQLNAEVAISFTLPSDLANGGNLLPIGAWTGYRNVTNAQAGGAALNPTAVTTTRLDAGSGLLFVFLGAQVSPGAGLPAGLYQNPVVMTVAYTGN